MFGFPGSVKPHYSDIHELVRLYMSSHNSDPIERVIYNGQDIAIIYLASHNAVSWKSSNVTCTVPSGKKLVLFGGQPSRVMSDITNRRWRLYNVTDAAVVPTYDYDRLQTSTSSAAHNLMWEGDVATPSKLTEISQGKQIRLEIWNGDTNRRAMGGYVFGRLEKA